MRSLVPALSPARPTFAATSPSARSSATTRTGPRTPVGRSTVTIHIGPRIHGRGISVETTLAVRTTHQDGLTSAATTRGGRTQGRTCGETTRDGRTLAVARRAASDRSAARRRRGTKHRPMYTGSRTSRPRRRTRGRRGGPPRATASSLAWHPGGDGRRAWRLARYYDYYLRHTTVIETRRRRLLL